MTCEIHNSSESKNLPLIIQPLNVLILPLECVLHIFSFLSFSDLPKVSLACRQWNKLSLKTYWDKVFTFTGNYGDTPNPIPKSAVKRLEMLFADTTAHQRKLRYFFRRCAKLDVTSQSNFLSNLLHTLNTLDTDNSKPRFKKFLTSVFSHPKCRKGTKLLIMEKYGGQECVLVRAIKWKGKPASYSIVPTGYKPFDCIIPDKKVLRKLKVHQNNTFIPGELVIVAERGNLPLFHCALYYGRVSSVSEVVEIFLQTQEDGSKHRITVKRNNRIAKYPQNMELPAFCK